MFKNSFQSARSCNSEGIHLMDWQCSAAYCTSQTLPRK
jgi:hypothetical protein